MKKEIWRQNLRIFFTSDPPVRPIVSTNDPPPAPAAQNNMITISAATGRVRTAIPYLHQELDNVHLSSALIVVPAMATISCHLRRKYYLQPTLRPRPSSHHDERNSLVISESNTRKDVDPDLINMACQTTWHICRCKLLLDMSTNRPQVRLHQTTPSIYWPQQQKDRCLRYISE